MLIIIHRVNTIEKLKKTPCHYGVEIDVRAYEKELVLCHDPYIKGEPLKKYLEHFKHAFIIFNIKEAGIEEDVINLANKHNIKNYFLLDVEYPFIYRATREKGFRKIAARYSEAEPIEFALLHKNMLDWVFIDTNTRLPISEKEYKELKNAGFKLCLVSPDRWGRPYDIKKYKKILSIKAIALDAVMVSLDNAGMWLD